MDASESEGADSKQEKVRPDIPSASEVSSLAKTPKTKFEVLNKLIEAVEVSDRDVVDAVFNLLVGGDFDLEVNFIIQDEQCIIYMLETMQLCTAQCQAEIWSKFKGICRKSYRNLQACVDVGLVQRLLHILSMADDITSEILIDMLCLLMSYNISVKELKKLLSMLKGENGKWPPHAVKLLGILKSTTERHGPDCFFNFPGKKDAAIALPPLKMWPTTNGFSFTTWFRMDPLNSLRVDVDKPYLYCFRNSKGMGYSGHFVGSCFIVTVLKSKGKGFQHCLKFEFKPRKWYMVTIVHIYNRWRSSEIKCYANGQLVSCCDMNWSIGGSDQYDKCFLGSAETGDESRVFCGQMAATYVFNEALTNSQVYALYQLGPGYKNQFKFPTESDHLLANHHRRVLYDDLKLADSLVLAYNPKSTDGQLCLECSPKTNQQTGAPDGHRWFVHSPHALMLPDVKAIVTHSIHSALHSVGGAEVLFPLFSQLDFTQPDGSLDSTVCSTLLNFLQLLLQGSSKTQQQVLQGKGFLVIGTLLEKARKEHVNADVLSTFISMSKFLDELPNGMPLMRQFCDSIMFNPALWIHTSPKVQLALYTYLATEFVTSPMIQTNVRRVSTLLLLINALKHYYWVVNPEARSGIIPKGLDGPRPAKSDLLSLRAFILLFLKQLVTRTGSILEDELQAVLGYLLTVHEDENIIDVLQLLVALLSEHGSSVVPVFDRQNGLMVIFKLLGSRSNNVRVHSLKLLAFFLKQIPEKRKEELMDGQSLFMLIGERLLLYPEDIGVETYNALYEVLVQDPSTQVIRTPHHDPSVHTIMHNPAMMKVIANMLRQMVDKSPEAMEIKQLFLHDLLKLFHSNRENRRILLQQSVWQDWMLGLGYVNPTDKVEHQCQELVYQIFKVLLYHAVKLEWGGWRVWVDTLSIVHSKVSFDQHKQYMEQMYKDYQQTEEKKKQTGSVSAITNGRATVTAPEPNVVEVVIEEVEDATEQQEGNETADAPVETPTEEHALQQEEATSATKEKAEEKENDAELQSDIAVVDDVQQKKSNTPEVQQVVQEDQRESDANEETNEEAKHDLDSKLEEQGQAESGEKETETEKDDKPKEESNEIEEDKESVQNDVQEALHISVTAEESADSVADKGGDEKEADLRTVGAEVDKSGDNAEVETDQSDVGTLQESEQVAQEKGDHSAEENDIIKSEETIEEPEQVESEENEFEDVDLNNQEKSGEDQPVEEEESQQPETEENEDAVAAETTPELEGAQSNLPADQVSENAIESPGQVATNSSQEEDNTSDQVATVSVQSQAGSSDQEGTGDPSDQVAKVKEQNPLNVTPLKSSEQDLEKSPVQDVQVEAQKEASGSQQQFSPGPRTVVFRVPEFKWSPQHLRLLDDLFTSLEGDIESWKSDSTTLIDTVNSNDNVIFVYNTIHLFSQMIDNVLLACGGILPILSSATSPTYELDTIEAGQGLSMEAAWSIVNRLASFMDILAFASTVNFGEIENEKNMATGGVLRQCLRTACICAVRNCLESRYVKRQQSAPPTPNYLSRQRSTSDTQRHQVVTNGNSEYSDHSSEGRVVVNDVEEEGDDLDVSATDAAEILLSLMSNSATPIIDSRHLLQDSDVNRLRSIIYRDIDDSKQAQYLSLAVVYFVSVLMVSKYRDILDPESHRKLQQATVARRTSPRRKKLADSGASFQSISRTVTIEEDQENSPDATTTVTNGHSLPDEAIESQSENKDRDHVAEKEPANSQMTSTDVQDILRNLAKRNADVTSDGRKVSRERVNPNSFSSQIPDVGSSYQSFDRSVVVQSKSTDPDASTAPKEAAVIATTDVIADDVEMQNGEADHADLPQIDPSTINVVEDEADVSARLERSMDQLAPLLRDIFLDFSTYLGKTLVGSHGQELLVEGLVCMKSYTSVVELVMLLCSQEWQNSIQKHAGLAFIELINEGRLLCHAMKDHVVRVANEADFILSKQRAEDVKKHALFESSCAIFLAQQRDEERQCDSLITAAKHRDHATAIALKNRITNILTNKLGAWGSNFNSRAREFWKLDPWEDDTRRRRRFVRNPYGSSHPEAILVTQKQLNAIPDASDAGAMPKSPSNFTLQGADQVTSMEDEVINLDDVDQDELQGPVSFSTEADLIAPGVCLHGNFSITPDEFFFEVSENHPSFTKADSKVLIYIDGIHGKWMFQEVRAVFSRRYLLQNTAVEVFLANRTCVMFNFSDNDTVKKVVGYLPRVGIGTGYGLPQARRISLASPHQLFKSSNMTEKWQRREITNFEYLMFLNTIAGRSFNDLNQYPVFPWVISNYDATQLDLSLPSNYRDLSKPVGALNPKRAAYFQSRFEAWDDPQIPKFHYGTHYSNAAFTLGWLLRVEPFTTLFLNLQGGKFDNADRTFQSVAQSWKNCQRDSHDVKELIPEFYYLPEMFVNANDYVLGVTSDAAKVNDVILPPWANSPDDFVRMNRMALESEIVSCQLHQWIDLIFGFKQRGPEAVRATNVFYYLTYENTIDLTQITDPIERIGLTDQIRNFGQTPSQLLANPHPPRSSAMHVTPMMFKDRQHHDVDMVLKFQSNSPVVYVAANTHPSLGSPAVVTCTKNLNFSLNRWNKTPEAKSSATASGAASAASAGEPDKPPAVPIEPDPLTTMTGTPNKRQIADTLDQSVVVSSSCFVITADNKFLVSCGYWDRSFRINHIDSGKLNQVVFGHWDVVTCVSRSETYIGGDCYFVTGSRDATAMLWYWSGRKSLIIGDSSTANENPTARAVLTGHDAEITCAAVCAELGLIASGSVDGPLLLHTITGDLLRTLEPGIPPDPGLKIPRRPELLIFTGEGMIVVGFTDGLLCNFTMNGRSLTHQTIDDNLRAIASSSNSQYLVTGGDKGLLQIWRTWDFKHLYSFPLCDAGIRSVAISHDQKTIVTGMMSGSIVAFHVNFNKWHYEYQDKF